MAKRGRKPQPPEIKILKSGRRAGPAPDEPVILDGPFLPPDHLDEEARAEWGRFVPVLQRAGLLARIDLNSLALYCEAFSLCRKATATIQAEGMFIKTARGGHQAHPALKIIRDAETRMIRLLIEFGCTPASRASLRLPPPDSGPNDELGRFLARKGRGGPKGPA